MRLDGLRDTLLVVLPREETVDVDEADESRDEEGYEWQPPREWTEDRIALHRRSDEGDCSALIGLAVGLTLVPLVWLTVFGRHRQIAYRGDWVRAIRRAAWVGIVVAVLIVLRLQGLLELPIALFIIALTVVAEATLSAER